MPRKSGIDKVVEAARSAGIEDKLSGRYLCDHCLGRLFGRVSTGLDNVRRGEAIRESIGMKRGQGCWLCEGLFDEVEKFSQLAQEKMNEVEFESFLIGSRIDPEIENREESLWAELNLRDFETIKSEVNREVGKLLEGRLRKRVEFENPDVVAVINTMFDDVELSISPLFVYGRYRKLARGIPQTIWTCRSCWGKGCEECAYSGREYETSVEEIIGLPFQEAVKCESFSFHGAGREDVDVRMLGNGRPFVLQLSRPSLRKIDFGKVGKRINESRVVEVIGLRASNRREMVKVKKARYPKSYRAVVEFSSPVDEQKLKEVVRTFLGIEIAQRTPRRVVKRRVDKVRTRRIHEMRGELRGERVAELRIRTDAGTYIKELVDGDQGRTRPSLAERLGADCKIRFLDVIEIHDEVGMNG